MKLSIIWLISSTMIFLMMLAVQMSQKKNIAYKEKWNNFECGFNSMNPTHIPFSFQFFLVALLFLIFDVEIALILSYPTESMSTKSTISMFLFMMILSIGLLYEWQKSKIEWSK